MSEDRLLTIEEVKSRVRVGTATLYRWMASGQFPEPLRVGPKCIRWPSAEVETWLQSRPRGVGRRPC